MSDVYSIITELPPEVVERLAHAMETRAASPRQREILETYLSYVDFPSNAHVLEIGCGTGAIARVLARRPGVAKVTGVDPSPLMLTKARELSGDIMNLDFQEGDGKALDFPASVFDAVVIHTVLCHVPGPEQILAEAHRVLRPGGWLALFDGDYNTISVSVSQYDPFGPCIELFKDSFVNDLWLVRRLPAMADAAGFDVIRFDSHGFVETSAPDYMLTIVDRGVDTLLASGIIGEELAAAMKSEAQRRVAQGQFFGSIDFASLIARRKKHLQASG